MSKVARRAVSIALASSVALLGAACSGGGDESNEITYWAHWNQDESQQVALAKTIADFEEANKDRNVKVNVEWQGRSNVQKLGPALNTDDVPDVVDGGYAQLVPLLGVSGAGADLTKVYEAETEDGKKVIDVIPEIYTSTDYLKHDGHFWMMPYSLTTEALWFNAKNFPELKDNPPKTWDEFVTFLDQVKAEGKLAPIALDGDISGYNNMWYTGFYVREHGAGSFMELAADKTGAGWDAPEPLEIAKRVEKLAKGGYFIDGYNASKFPAQQQAWATNKAGFLLCGSWIPTETKPYADPDFEYASISLPANQQEKSVLRADFIGFAVPDKAKNKDLAMEFVAFAMKKDQQQAMATEGKSLTVRDDVEPFADLADIAANISNADELYRAGDGIVWPGFGDKTFQPINDDLLLGKITAEEFVKRAKEAQINYWKDQG